MDRRTARKRTLIAGILALLAHLGTLWGLGWRSPGVATPPLADENRAVEVQLMRPRHRSSAPASGRASTQLTPHTPASPAPGPAPAVETAVTPPSTVQASGGGAGDCAPEDLALLTDAERQHCRNQIDAESGRRMARGADERLAKRLAALSSAPRVDVIPGEKRAYYDAVAAAYAQQSHGPPMAGLQPGVGCSIKFSGLTIIKSKPPPNSLHLGPCFIAPPQGFLTEESGVAPP